MFKPTHLARLHTRDGIRLIALELQAETPDCEIFRDVANVEHHQCAFAGVVGWPSYEIRALVPGECVTSDTLRPVWERRSLDRTG